ncbi:MAG: DUF4097 domain-containing protein [Parasporobacterium sp.]|nr:DUF4097 domain-containing protein [Parasporobacterium sp.]
MRKPRWTKVYLIIIWCFTLLAIVIGVSRMTGWFNFSVGKAVEETISFDSDLKTNELTGIVIDADAADLTIQYGDSFNVAYNYPEKNLPNISFEDGKLEIKETMKKSFTSLWAKKYLLIVTLPKDANIEDIDIEVDMGDIKLNKIGCEDLTINANMGNVVLKDLNVESGSFDLDMGNLEISSSSFDRIEAVADMGNIEVSGNIESMSAECDMGNIEVKTNGNVDLNKFNLHCDLGNVEVNGTKWKNK